MRSVNTIKLKLFNNVLIIGVGLIGSSIAKALQKNSLANNILGYDTDHAVKDKCKKLNIIDEFIL